MASDGAALDLFGYAVAITGPTALVAAYNKNSGAGAVYVFGRSDSRWSQQAKLTASDGAPGDLFGFSMAMSGSSVLVGASGYPSNIGAAYVFVRSSNGNWSQQAKLIATDGDPNEVFGDAVAISGNTAVVGAPINDSRAGAAYVFGRSSNGKWSQQAKLTASDRDPNDVFGASVAISGSTAMVGALNENSEAGAVYVFGRSESNWSQQAKLTASDGLPRDGFGVSVDMSGSTALIGAYNKNSGAGVAYVFVGSDSNWSEQSKLAASDGAAGDQFGYDVAISGSTGVVGAYAKDRYTGAAYLYRVP
jgi:hypothetical protein